MIVDPLFQHGCDANEARLGRGPKGSCACDEDRDAAMTANGRCYGCDLAARGMPVVEGHHVYGPDVPIIVDVPANEHRVLDALRANRHPLLRKPSGDMLANVAGLLMQFTELAEIGAAAADRGQAPRWRGQLDDLLARHGREAAETLLALTTWLDRQLPGGWRDEAPQWGPTR
jgi:hypothetical protein